MNVVRQTRRTRGPLLLYCIIRLNPLPTLPRSTDGGKNGSYLHDRNRLEFAAEDWLHGGVEPGLEDAGVDTAEIGGVFEVAVIQVGEGGVFADDAGFYTGAEEEHGGGGAVVCAGAGVLGDTAAELAEGHHENALIVLLVLHVLPEGFDALGELLHEVVVALPLAGVGIETRQAHVVDAGRQAAADHGGDGSQALAELTAGVLGG